MPVSIHITYIYVYNIIQIDLRNDIYLSIIKIIQQ